MAIVLTEDQVNPMFYATNRILTRAMFQLMALLLVVAGGTGAAFAANSGFAPQLIPYTSSVVAGNSQKPGAGGYGGDGQLGPAATISSLETVAVDSVGNVYFADRTNAIIREVNAQTGIVTTIAGITPSKCVGTSCTTNSGCADGVPALGGGLPVGISGMAIDAYDNIYFTDTSTNTVSIIYHGGTQVANFIKLVNPTGVTTSGGSVQVGYVYHVAGTIALATCSGSTTKLPSVPDGNPALAFQGPTFTSAVSLTIDSAGNIYIADGNTGSDYVRVINTQSTPQTFFANPTGVTGPGSAGTTIQPGYIAAVVNCGSETQLCGNATATLTQAYTGVGEQAGNAQLTILAAGDGSSIGMDAYGNLYEVNYKNGIPGIYGAVAYAGGSALANMIKNANADSPIANVPGLTAVPGDFYWLLQNITLRPSSLYPDAFGNLYYEDNHYSEVYRVDVDAPTYASDLLQYTTLFASARNAAATPVAPAFCYGAGGSFAPSATNPTLTGYTTTDTLGDGCPVALTKGPTYGITIADGPGNLYLADLSNVLVRKVVMNNMFPTTAVGQSVQQTLQIHFDPSNLPVQTTPAPTITTSSFSIAPGISDFTINPIATSWTTQSGSGTMIGNTAFTSTATGGLTSLPLCTNLTGSVDTSLDCVVNVVFTPTAPGQRVSQLVVTTANGSVYNFALTGNATGSQLAIDGGAQAVVPVTGLGTTGQIAVTSNGTGYIADPTNNRIVVCTPAATCATQTTIGTGLKGPMGVAVDGANNVYISDTGNNRILKVNPITGVQTTLGAVLAVGSPAYPQYSFKGPQGIAVDTTGNVYVADTGNGKVVEIPSNPILGGATPLLSYPTAPFFSSPTTVSVDQYGNVYVVDPTAIQVLKLPPGGGDWQNLITTTSTKPDQGLPGLGTNLVAPIGGVAVDGGGNLYISDIATNAVYELPSATGPGSAQFQLSFYGVKSPGALALDSSGNLYLSDTGNGRVLFMNRTNPTVSFGTVPQDLSGASGVATANCPVAGSQTVCTGYLTVTNIGNQPITLTSPLTTVTGVSPTGDTAFNITNTCTSPLPAGLTCTISPTFLPTSDGQQTETVDVNGTQTMSLVANVTAVGEQPLANVVLTAGYSTGTAPTAGATATITATVTQPHLTGVTPTGTVTFTYVITGTNATCGSSGSVTVALVPGSGGASTASFPLPTLALGRQYTVNASYSGDSQSSFTLAAPLAIYVPGIPVTATSSSITFAYGTNPPTITGTVTGILPTDTGVTYAFGTAASATTPIGVYPITVTFSGTNSCNYGIPQVLTSSGAPATATETAAALNVKVNNATAPYGAANISYTSVITGNVNGDQFTETYVPAQSSILNVGTYSIVPTVGGLATQNYAVTATPGTLTITLAPTAVSVSAPKTSVLPTALSTAAIQVFAGTTVTAGKGTPTGTITVSDTFTPITATAPGTGPTVPACSVTVTSGCNATVTLPLVAGEVTYTPTSTTLGTHVYTFAYSGDSNFQPSNTTLSPTTLLVDNADFSLVSTTTPIQIAPGVIPGGNAAVAGEAAATPEQATVSVTSILSLSGLISLSCTPQNPTYVSCSLAPPSVTLTGSTTAVTSTLSVSTPATLPLGFTFSSELRRSGEKTVLAFLPFGVLAFCLRKRKRLSKALWMLIAIGVVSSGISACGGNSVHDYVPVPAGAQSVTIYASGTSTTTNTVVTRSFVVPINIQ